jgi:hypothetical protein
MRVLLTGSTTWTDATAIRRELAKLPAHAVVIHGDCPGVDELGGRIAADLGLKVECWAKDELDAARYGNQAWQGLNERMLAAGVDLVLAFHPDWAIEGKAHGTRHLLGLAEAAGVEVRAFDR